LKIPPISESSASPSPTQPRILLPDLPDPYIHSTAADHPSPARLEPSAYQMDALRVARCACSWIASSRLTGTYLVKGRWLLGKAWTTVVWPSTLTEVGGVRRARSPELKRLTLSLTGESGRGIPGLPYGLGGGGRYCPCPAGGICRAGRPGS
jgi:hypothetical protein